MISQILSYLTSLPVNTQWPSRQALFYFSFCALIPTPAPGQGLSASCSFQRAILFDNVLSEITSSQCLPQVPELHHASFQVLTFQFMINYSAAHFQPKSSFLQCPFSSSHHLRVAFPSNDMFTICALPDIKATSCTQEQKALPGILSREKGLRRALLHVLSRTKVFVSTTKHPHAEEFWFKGRDFAGTFQTTLKNSPAADGHSWI